MNNQSINYVIPYGKHEITPEDIACVVEVLKSDFLTQGPVVQKFENKFREFLSVDYAVAVCNATAALHLAFKVLNRSNTKKVICTSLSFVATSNCVLYEGGQVEFVDIDSETLNLDIEKVAQVLSKNPSDYQGIIIVDFAGYPADLVKLRAIADKYGLWIIEDACHAIGASRGQEFSGSGIADISVFSFHPVKHIAAGEGGMLTTRNESLYQHLLKLRSHGIERKDFTEESHGGWYYEMQELGYNYRMSDINAALGESQMNRIGDNLKKRRQIALRYFDGLSDLPLKLPNQNESIKHAYHLFVIQLEKRKELYDFLKKNNIYTQVHYLPIHMQPYYKKIGHNLKLENCENYYKKCLSIPMYHSLPIESQEYVISKIKEFFR